MSTTAPAMLCEGMYSKLIDNEADFDGLNAYPNEGQNARPAPSVRVAPRTSGAGPYRLATICLAVLSAVLLVSIIAVAAHYKASRADGGGPSANAEPQKQAQDANVTVLVAALAKLRQEKASLQREKEELLAEMAAATNCIAATTVPGSTQPVTGPTPPVTVCPRDWQLFSGSCYYISRRSMSWRESQSYCQRQGGHLAIIHTAEEQTFVWNQLPRGHWNAFWFGISDEHTEDDWKWVDGTTLVGGFWEEGEPNNHIDEDCGYIVKTQKLERVPVKSWYDAPCSMPWPFICEKELALNG